MEKYNERRSQLRWELLQKEMEEIGNTIRNLDDIIHKTKNFAFLAWGGSLFLIVQHLTTIGNCGKSLLIVFTLLIPLIFFLMDLKWRKNLLICNERGKMISYFINSEHFEQLIVQGNQFMLNENGKEVNFPQYDIIGKIFTKRGVFPKHVNEFSKEYLINLSAKKFNRIEVAKYKDVLTFYGALIVVSLFFGFLHFYFTPCN